MGRFILRADPSGYYQKHCGYGGIFDSNGGVSAWSRNCGQLILGDWYSFGTGSKGAGGI